MKIPELSPINWEELVVGSLLQLQGGSVGELNLTKDDFAEAVFSEAYGHIQDLVGGKGFADVFMVRALMSGKPYGERVLDAWERAFYPANLHYYATKVLEASIERQLLIIAAEVSSGGDVQEKIDVMKGKLEALKVADSFEMPEIRWDLQMMLNEILNPKRTIPTCFKSLNNLIVGFKQSGLYVVGARPGVGKTAFGMQLAWEMSRNDDVLFFSLEMDKNSLLNRVVAGELSIPLDGLERGVMLPENLARINNLIKVVQSRLIINDSGGQSIAQIRNYLRAVLSKRPVKAIFVDYLQLTQPDNGKASKYEQISQISMALKNIAKEFAIPVIALAQLNRRVDGKPDDRPNAADLRDSGQIEQDADVIIMLSRKQSELDVVEDTRIVRGESQAGVSLGNKSLIVIDVVKNRHGATGWFEAKFDGEFSRIRELQRAG